MFCVILANKVRIERSSNGTISKCDNYSRSNLVEIVVNAQINNSEREGKFPSGKDK